MELYKVHLHAFRSLLDKELEIKTNCIGFVGINESGKSNILDAINVIRGDRKLLLTDCPKMARENSPYLSYYFKLDPQETDSILNLINQWRASNTIIDNDLIPSDFTLSYHVQLVDQNELRWFEINELKIDKKILILKHDKLNSSINIIVEDKSIPLDKAVIITESTLKENEKLDNIASNIIVISNNISTLENELKQLEGRREKSQMHDEKKNDQPVDNVASRKMPNNDESQLMRNQIESLITKKQKELDNLKKNKTDLEKILGDYNRSNQIDDFKKNIKDLTIKLNEPKKNMAALRVRIDALKKEQKLDETQKNSLNSLENEYDTSKKTLQQYTNDIEKAENSLSIIQESLSNCYSHDVKELKKHLAPLLESAISKSLPKVVFWKYDQNYLLQSQTLFSEILEKDDLNKIPRPLLNTFRIGLNITTLESLKSKIKEIQDVPDERSRLQKKLTKKINEFLKGVWSDYDQDISINLEQERIRVEVYDPKREDASYYSMIERSQGFQTFISFLLTIGAEAQHGVIKNTILLLDEPETHLHPSGVRFMLRELIRIAESENIVFFATHSIFMIDRNYYNRYIILNKKEEQTIIVPACQDRIGYFMQEEVLYNTLDVDLNKDFESTNTYNFVFEGKGDAILFEYFYRKVLSKANQPLKIENTSFYPGGKCSDIQRYFTSKPIQLGTKWIFILDSDQPADHLSMFIKGKYRAYINKDIFVFQYGDNIEDIKELEDILPKELLRESISQTLHAECITGFDVPMLEQIMEKKVLFSDYVEDIFPVDSKTKLKARLKDILNGLLSDKLKKINIKDFESAFPNYYNCVNTIVSDLQKALDKTGAAKGDKSV